MNLPKLYELKTWDKRSWALTDPEYKQMNQRLEAGAKFLVIPDGSESKVSVSDVKFFGKRQISLGDVISEQKALPQGEKKFDPLAKGYIKFLAMSVKMRIRGQGNVSLATAKITDEQKPLVNAELERMGIDFRV